MSPAAAVAHNPAIDPVWYAKEMATLNTKLAGDFPDLPADMIRVALQLASKRIAADATIPNYLPVLVGRDARAQLQAYAAGIATK
ncbi:MAG TPA: hypothetical protein VGJ14_08695 [Sporichthyaceae bacterium]|jgi:hypothetical protein